MKYEYRCNINNPVSRLDYLFAYNQTSNIRLGVKKDGASFVTAMTKDYSSDLFAKYLINLVKEGVKRTVLVYLLKYSESLVIRRVEIEMFCDGKALKTEDLTERIPLFCLIEGKLLRKLPGTFGEREMIQQILGESNSQQGSRMAGLLAYLYSRSKKYEIERFNYQWMAINGMYSFLWPDTNVRSSDREKMNHLADIYGFGGEVLSQRTRDCVAQAVLDLIMITPYMEDIAESIIAGEDQEFVQGVRRILDENDCTISVYGYLLLDFSYSLRCKIFHANKPIPMISYKNDKEIRALVLVNRLLEHFLDWEYPTLYLSED